MDWRLVRSAVEAAYPVMGEQVPGNIPDRDWALANATINAFCEQNTRTCVECKEPIEYRAEIKCLDCKAMLHERCAPRHFWPNGRPSQTAPHGNAR